MFKKIKMLAALLLLVSLCLPLSKCTVQANPLVKDQNDKVFERYVAEIDNKGSGSGSGWGYLLIAPFVLPVVMVLLHIKMKQEKLRFEILDVFLGLMVIAVVMLHKLTGQLMFGGYLAFSAALAYLLASILESGMTIKNRYIDKNRC